ncbi:hypothetical protein [Ancylobacter mangrovi]|uniref:Uncharacterized protein n=1 Tax=Ancylobacter mangrovi TaxID=2972472 RepID=A0A9X2PIL6_9HYPH|nr:hypothetical protein [Ancylobacter mangrovi]MCS0496800.1 hypothetical protein [Ancylobacter mangrovi]MCS0504854.1 hypothetical protein [Ancylobacter mangrovi]
MSVFMVTFDLRNPANVDAMVDAIKLTSWTQLGPTTYAVSTAETDEELFFRLRAFTQDRDGLYVALLRKPYRGMGFREVNHWLEENLRW